MFSESPCKRCELHKTDFPNCLENCEAIHEFQIFLINNPESCPSKYSTFEEGRYILSGV